MKERAARNRARRSSSGSGLRSSPFSITLTTACQVTMTLFDISTPHAGPNLLQELLRTAPICLAVQNQDAVTWRKAIIVPRLISDRAQTTAEYGCGNLFSLLIETSGDFRI